MRHTALLVLFVAAAVALAPSVRAEDEDPATLLRQAIVVFALPGLALTAIPWLINQLRNAGEPSVA